jgi:nucleoside-diphosphate-sugar epimerase
MTATPILLVTGATGFVGGSLLSRWVAERPDQLLVAGTRKAVGLWPAQVRPFDVGDFLPNTNWSAPLSGVRQVVHTAARVHVMADKNTDQLAEFRRVNVDGTLNLAQQAAAAGVARFVFLSSAKVNGEATQIGEFFEADAVPAPLDAYGISKMEAEQGLREIAAQTGMEIVIIRPTLVYGPGVKANFASMMRWIQRGVPLPLGSIHNQRSLVSLYNLVDLILTCLSHPAAANQTFMVSDGEDVSTTELLRRLGQALNCPARLLPLPESWFKVVAGFVGRADIAQRLCGSLQVDISKTRQLLGWKPPLTLDEGLAKMAQGIK